MKTERERFASLLHEAAALWRFRVDAQLRPWGLTQATWRTLWALRSSKQSYSQHALATRLGIEAPTLVRIVDRMETKGLVARRPDPKDRRQNYVEITPQGMALAREIEREVVSVRAAMLSGLDAEALASGIALLEHIVETAQKHP